jgi:hypothetical protein
MISLLFVFCQLVVMQVCWIKACAVNALISAKLEHYTCMADLLYPAGHLEDTENMINTMPCKPDAASWMALLGTCRIHGNVEMAEHLAKGVLELEPKNAASYVLQ